MKAILVLIMLGSISLLTACNKNGGSGDSSNSNACSGTGYDRRWIDPNNGDQLVLSGSCTGTSSACGSVFSYTRPQEGNPFVTVTIQQTNGAPGCLPVGPKLCSISINGAQTTMLLNCGFDTYYHAF